jgi:hypothetical protein
MSVACPFGFRTVGLGGSAFERDCLRFGKIPNKYQIP